MQPVEARYPAPSGWFFLLLASLGGIAGLVLLVLRAPFWLFFVAPFVMVPFVVVQLRALNVEEEPRRKERRAQSAEDRHPASRFEFPLVWVGLAVLTALLPLSLINGEGLVGLGGLIGALALVGLLGLLLAVALLESFSLGKRREGAGRSFQIGAEEARVLADEAARADARAKRSRPHRPKARVQPSAAGQWVVSGQRSRQLGRFDTQLEALQAAERYLIDCGGGDLLTRGRDPRSSEVRIAIRYHGQRAFRELLERVELEEIRDRRS